MKDDSFFSVDCFVLIKFFVAWVMSFKKRFIAFMTKLIPFNNW